MNPYPRAPGDIDTGALILIGVAVRRANARTIGELFSAQAGKFVSVSAGDGLETPMAVHGSGAMALSATGGGSVMNIDIAGRMAEHIMKAAGGAELGDWLRLRGLSRGVIAGLGPLLDNGHPLILVVDGDIGGLIGMHCRQEENLTNPVISIDGIELSEFDFLDIGEVPRATGALPVVIKSLLFPGE
ncbi:MAG: ethanolamine ammonia-lyase reactivating factor EutA [Proteobacteria bacterium]|nr:ethanolamine ammonia-lyase reactivating factor EutA [Pseudomonadota bacterium]